MEEAEQLASQLREERAARETAEAARDSLARQLQAQDLEFSVERAALEKQLAQREQT